MHSPAPVLIFGNDGEAQPFAIDDDPGEAQPRGKEKIVWH